MCLYMLPQGVRAERKVFASACCIDTDSPAYLCTSPVLEQAIYKQTKPPKRNTPSLRAHECQRLRTHTRTNTHTRTRVSFAPWPLWCFIQVYLTERDSWQQKILLSSTKNQRGQLYSCSIVSDSLALFPACSLFSPSACSYLLYLPLEGGQ